VTESGIVLQSDGLQLAPQQAHVYLDADSDNGSESDDSTASEGTARTATPRRYGVSSRGGAESEEEEDLDNMFQRALDQARSAAKVDEAGGQDDLLADVMMVGEKLVKDRYVRCDIVRQGVFIANAHALKDRFQDCQFP
jgi:hypothetical protein